MLNNASIIGRVGNKKIRPMSNGEEIVSLSIATTKSWKNKQGEKEEKTTWHNVNFFRKLAEIAGQWVEVGDLIYVDGEINYQPITSGVREGQYAYSVTANQLKMLSSGNKKKDEPSSRSAPKNKNKHEEELDDDIPF